MCNRKLPRCISIVLASSALCSSSLVSAIDRTTKIWVPILWFISKDNITGCFPDGTNKKLFEFFFHSLLIDNKVFVDSKIGEIDSVYANGEKFTVCCTDCETWFRDMICQLCAHLDKEDFLEVCKIIKLNFGEGSSNVDCGESFSKLFSSICELFDCYDGYFGSFDNGIVDARNEWMRSCDIPGYGVPCRIPDKFCTGVVSIKFWKVMTIFFKTFLIDLANKSSDVANLSKEDFEQTYYSHCFDLAIDIFKLFEIDLEKETETEIHKCQELRQDINKNNFAEKIDGALEFLYEYRAPYRVKPPFNKLNETEKGKLLSCLGSFCTFIKSLVDSGQLEKLLK